MASKAENVSIWWRHHVFKHIWFTSVIHIICYLHLFIISHWDAVVKIRGDFRTRCIRQKISLQWRHMCVMASHNRQLGYSFNSLPRITTKKHKRSALLAVCETCASSKLNVWHEPAATHSRVLLNISASLVPGRRVLSICEMQLSNTQTGAYWKEHAVWRLEMSMAREFPTHENK